MSTYLNVDVVNAVNPIISDVGVGVVFGLGYYVIKYMYGEQKDESKMNKEKIGTWDSAATIEDFNSLIKDHECDPSFNPFEVIDKMGKKSITPDITIFNNLLNTSYVSANFEAAEKLEEEMFDFASPVQPDLSSYNILLKGVSIRLDKEADQEEKKKLIEQMNKIFDNLKKHSSIKPTDVTLNTILDILIKGGLYQKAWDLFDEMRSKYDVEPDKYSYSTIIKALKYDLDSSKLERAFGLLEYLKTKNTELNDEIIFNCLIDVCIKLNCIDKAEKVFYQMKDVGVFPSKITYAIMIKGYGQIYDLERAFKIFEEMKENNVVPNEIIYGCLLHACVRCSNIEKVTYVYNEMKNNEIEFNVVIYTTLVKAYTKARKMEEALEVYNTLLKDEKVQVNIIAHNAMLDCCVENRKFDKMQEIYDYIKSKFIDNENAPQPDLITYSTVIKGFARAGNMDKVFDMYGFLKTKEFKLDEVMYNSILDGCAKSKNLSKALEIYNDMKTLGINRSNVTYSILIKLYANDKKDQEAFNILKEMKEFGIKPGMIVYTCLIQMCLRTKRFEKAIELFEEMKSSSVKPDHVLYNTIVNGCLYHYKNDMACKYTLESFNFDIKMADDIYTNVLERIVNYNCDLKSHLKCEYASQIIMNLKNRHCKVDNNIYSKVAKMIYKIKGVRLGLSKSPEKKSERKWDNYNDVKNQNRDNLKSQRSYKNYNSFK